MIFDGFIDDFEVFDEKGVVPKQHLEKVEKIKLKLNSWNIKKNWMSLLNKEQWSFTLLIYDYSDSNKTGQNTCLKLTISKSTCGPI